VLVMDANRCSYPNKPFDGSVAKINDQSQNSISNVPRCNIDYPHRLGDLLTSPIAT
jgi:hypothetical protein